MKVFLVGHSGSKHVVSATSWLIEKYLPDFMEIIFMKSGKSYPHLYKGMYIDVGRFSSISPRLWSLRIVRALKGVQDPFIILGLDDFFLSKSLNIDVYNCILELIESDKRIVCAHLSISPEIQIKMPQIKMEKYPQVVELPKEIPYLISTQYSIWRREYLLKILEKVRTPWEFEVLGTELVSKDSNAIVIQAFPPALAYPEPSALSSRSPGYVSVLGNKVTDILELVQRGHLKLDTLIMGQWIGEKKFFKDFKYDVEGALDLCPPEELDYYKSMLRQCRQSSTVDEDFTREDE